MVTLAACGNDFQLLERIRDACISGGSGSSNFHGKRFDLPNQEPSNRHLR